METGIISTAEAELAFRQWALAVDKELKSDGGHQKLIWNPEPEIAIPSYQTAVHKRAEQFAQLVSQLALKQQTSFLIGLDVDGAHENPNQAIHQSFEHGVGALRISRPVLPASEILKGVQPGYLYLEWIGGDTLGAIDWISANLPSELQSSADGGVFLSHTEGQMPAKEQWLGHHVAVKSTIPQYRTIRIDAGIAADAGASIAQQIAFALIQAKQFLLEAKHAGVAFTNPNDHVHFHFNQGNQYLLECVKTRTFAGLWHRMLELMHLPSDSPASISTGVSSLYLTAGDRHNNMLRITAATMASVLSGSKAHFNPPFDHFNADKSSESQRLSHAISLVLLEESFLGKVKNPSLGSYALDNLQYELAEKAWDQFARWEEQGDYRELFAQGAIQRDIQAHAQKLQEQFDQAHLKLVGVNVYPNKQETSPTAIPIPKASNPNGLQAIRLAEKLEKQN